MDTTLESEPKLYRGLSFSSVDSTENDRNNWYWDVNRKDGYAITVQLLFRASIACS